MECGVHLFFVLNIDYRKTSNRSIRFKEKGRLIKILRTVRKLGKWRNKKNETNINLPDFLHIFLGTFI